MTQTNQDPKDPTVSFTLEMPLSAVNFLLQTLDRNPLNASVMQVAELIKIIQKQVQAGASSGEIERAGGTSSEDDDQVIDFAPA
jgi:hypothetical protein